MRLFAISDLHLANQVNREALQALRPYPDDWLILAGDVGETAAHLEFALSILASRFHRLVWVPGNHDLWTMPSEPNAARGVARYQRQVEICRHYGALTPEDPYITWSGAGDSYVLAPTFTLYDYSFRPEEVPADLAVEWAAQTGVVCSDEFLLHPDPYPSRQAWCEARCNYTEQRLSALTPELPIVLINHYPLRREFVRFQHIPRFSLWCGTRRTEDWHRRFPIAVAIYGHLHMRATRIHQGVRWEEVSFGYPRDWDHTLGLAPYLRQILPVPRSQPWLRPL